MSLFIEIALIVAIATAFSIAMRLLKQPLIVGYILAGVSAGPYFLNVLHSTEALELFSKIGIAILLFIVGLHLSPEVVKEVGRISVVGGVGQVVFTSLIGFGIARIFHFSIAASLYIAIALTFSSTIIVLKMLSDRGDLNKLYGKISVGFLLIQDIIACAMLVVVSALSAQSNTAIATTLLLLLLKAIGIGCFLYLLVRFVLPRFSNFFGSSQELLFLSTIAWGLGVGALFFVSGFSIEIGALVAGVLMSLSPFAYEMSSRLKPLRDFFLVLFFVFLGSQMVVTSLSTLLIPGIVFALFVLIGNPLIVFILMNLLGYRRRTAFFSGLTVAQISEFSLILAALGLSLGHISREVVSLITIVGLVTIAGSAYFFIYADVLYQWCEPALRLFEWRRRYRPENILAEGNSEVLIFGYDRVGIDFVEAARQLGKGFLVIDFNPKVITRLKTEQIPHRYGDAEDVEFLEELELKRAKLIISTIPDFHVNLALLKHIRRINDFALIILVSHTIKEAQRLYAEGATFVVMPHYLGAQYAKELLGRHKFNVVAFEAEKERHLAYMARRSEPESGGA